MLMHVCTSVHGSPGHTSKQVNSPEMVDVMTRVSTQGVAYKGAGSF